jgi:hypothetical protein
MFDIFGVAAPKSEAEDSQLIATELGFKFRLGRGHDNLNYMRHIVVTAECCRSCSKSSYASSYWMNRKALSL